MTHPSLRPGDLLVVARRHSPYRIGLYRTPGGTETLGHMAMSEVALAVATSSIELSNGGHVRRVLVSTGSGQLGWSPVTWFQRVQACDDRAYDAGRTDGTNG